MPSKKKAEKNSSKKSDHKAHKKKEVKKEISKAVDSLPGIIVEHAAWDEIRKDPPRSQKKRVPHYEEPQYATLLTWVGVTVVSLFIIGLWIWNTRTLINDAVLTPSTAETSLFKNAQEDFRMILSSISGTEDEEPYIDEEEEAANKEKTKQEITKTLTALIPVIPTSTATSSPTTTP